MNDDVLYASSKEDIIEYCMSLDNCKTDLSVICEEQKCVIRDLSNAVRGFSNIIRAEHEFEMAIRRNLWIENKIFDSYDNSFRPVNDPLQGQKMEKENQSLSGTAAQGQKMEKENQSLSGTAAQGQKMEKENQSLSGIAASAVEGCFG